MDLWTHREWAVSIRQICWAIGFTRSAVHERSRRDAWAARARKATHQTQAMSHPNATERMPQDRSSALRWRDHVSSR